MSHSVRRALYRMFRNATFWWPLQEKRMYQGHHQDGSSIQRHSAGSHYPYIVGKRESRGWFVLHPNGTEEYRSDGDDAFAYAEQLAATRNANH